MSEDGIACIDFGGYFRPSADADRKKATRRLKSRAERLLRKAEIAEKRGNNKRRNQLLDQADECLLQAEQLS